MDEISSKLEEYDSVMCTNIFYIEKEIGAYITDEYPMSKLLSQIEELNEHNKREAREMKKSKRGSTLR